MRCIVCKRKLRPPRTLATDYPDTVSHRAHGKCGACYEAASGGRPGRTSVPKAGRPTTNPVAELIRFIPGAGHQMVTGHVVSVSEKRYVLRLANGFKGTYDRTEWHEVLA